MFSINRNQILDHLCLFRIRCKTGTCGVKYLK